MNLHYSAQDLEFRNTVTTWLRQNLPEDLRSKVLNHKRLTREDFVRFLRSLGEKELLTQAHDGTLLLGRVGERLVNHYSFYAAFASAEEFRLMAAGRVLGTMPIEQPLFAGAYLIFGGRRWCVLAVHGDEKVVELEPAPGGRVPMFDATAAGGTHDRVRVEMRTLYDSAAMPRYLDVRAQELLAEGRAAFQRLSLSKRAVIAAGRDVYLFPWRGDAVLHTLALQLRARNLGTEVLGPLLKVAGSQAEVEDALRGFVASGPARSEALTAEVENLVIEKHDGVVPVDLLARDYAARRLDVEGAWRAAQALVS